MKTNKFIENSNKAMASFFLTGLVVLTIWCFKNTDYYQDTYFTFGTDCHTAMVNKTNSTSYNSDMKQLQEINEKIANLEQKMTSMYNKLEKAKNNRNKNYGMAVGMYYQPSTEMAEITNLEGNIAKLNHKIENLKMQEKNIAQKYGTDVQNLAFIK